MYKEKTFRNTRFCADVLRISQRAFIDGFDIPLEKLEYERRVTIDEVEWGHDSMEEFLSDYRLATG